MKRVGNFRLVERFVLYNNNKSAPEVELSVKLSYMLSTLGGRPERCGGGIHYTLCLMIAKVVVFLSSI